MVFFGNFLLTTKESYSCRSTKLPIPRPQAQRLFAAVRFPSRNRRFPDRCRSPDCASTAFHCRCLLLRQKLFVLPCRRLRNNYILCPTGTPTFAAARRQRRDLIIAHSTSAPTPTLTPYQRQRRKRYKQSPEPTTLPTALYSRVCATEFVRSIARQGILRP